jgi:hypothetical protein
MRTHATGTFDGTSWNEMSFSEVEGGAKLTRASVTNTFQGDIEGEGTLEYLLIYRDDGSCSFIGAERVVGRVGDRSGSFVLQHSGIFEGGAAKGSWSVVPGTATGDLRGLRGDGGYVATHGTPASCTLTYDFE